MNNEKLINFLLKLVCVFISCILFLLVIASCFLTAKLDSTVGRVTEMIIFSRCSLLRVLISFIIFLIILLVAIKFLKKVNTKKLIIVGLFFILCISIIWIFFSKILPRADMKSITDTAVKLKNGNVLEFEKGGYFDIYPFQLGYLLVIEILFKICESVYFVQIVNAITIVAIMFILYKITDMLFKNEIVSKIMLVLECGCIYLFMYSTMIYGNILGLMFALLSILFLFKYLEKNKILDAILMGVTIIASIIIKSNYLIFLVAEFIVIILDIFSSKDIKKLY